MNNGEKELRDIDVKIREARMKQQSLLPENKKLEKTLESLKSTITEYRKKLDQITSIIIAKESEKNKVFDEIRKANENLVQLNNDTQAIKDNLEQKKEELDIRERNIDNMVASRQESLDKEIKRYRELISEYEVKNNSLKEYIQIAEDLKMQNKSLNEKLKTLKNDYQEKLKEVEGREVSQKESGIKLKKSIEKHQKSVIENEATLEYLAQLEIRLKKREQDLKIKHDEVEVIKNNYTKMLDSVNAQKKSFENQQESIKTEAMMVEKDKLRVQLLINNHKLENEVKELKEKLAKAEGA